MKGGKTHSGPFEWHRMAWDGSECLSNSSSPCGWSLILDLWPGHRQTLDIFVWLGMAWNGSEWMGMDRNVRIVFSHLVGTLWALIKRVITGVLYVTSKGEKWILVDEECLNGIVTLINENKNIIKILWGLFSFVRFWILLFIFLKIYYRCWTWSFGSGLFIRFYLCFIWFTWTLWCCYNAFFCSWR